MTDVLPKIDRWNSEPLDVHTPFVWSVILALVKSFALNSNLLHLKITPPRPQRVAGGWPKDAVKVFLVVSSFSK